LRFTFGGFGTPFFGMDRQIRVVADQLIDQCGSDAHRIRITTLSSAAEFLGTEIDPHTASEDDSTPLGDTHETLVVDPEATAFLGSWYGMATASMEAIRSDTASVDATRPQVWPGHFDAGIEIGDERTRATYGASPGDESIDEPYLYVSIWWPDRVGISSGEDFWNAPTFLGRVLRLHEMPNDADPAAVAADFFRETRDRL
jgi:hypothetical protein